METAKNGVIEELRDNLSALSLESLYALGQYAAGYDPTKDFNKTLPNSSLRTNSTF